MKKTLQLVMLPTEKRNEGLIFHGCNMEQLPLMYRKDTSVLKGNFNGYHLHLVSNEDIKEGDWIVGNFLGDISCRQAVKYRGSHLARWGDKKPTGDVWTHSGETYQQFKNPKKIIATTDSSLKEVNAGKDIPLHQVGIDYIPQIPESLIKAFVESNGKMTEVEVEYIINPNFTLDTDIKYRSILKLTPNNEIIWYPKEEKMYSREELQQLKEDIQHVCTWYQGREVDRCERVEKWIKDNL